MTQTSIKATFAATFALSTAATAASAQDILPTDEVQVRSQIVADGLASPWGFDFLPDGAILVTEKGGDLRIVRDGTVSEPVEGVPAVSDQGQGGLLDVTVASDFADSGMIFLSFSEPGQGGAGTAIATGRLVQDEAGARLENMQVIFSMEKKTTAGQHFGSRIVEHSDGTLFFSIGDRGAGDRAQDPQDHAGSILRINKDGTIPADNPDPEGARQYPEIWSMGHRNAQGMVLDPVTGGIVTAEHGARGGDEVNLAEAGKNYGWPVISYGRNYSGTQIGEGTQAEGYEQPLHYWDPSIAPSGLAVYQGEMFPEWEGDLLVGALKFQLVSRLERDGEGRITGEERMFDRSFGRVRDIDVAPDGSVYLLTDDSNGLLVRLSRAD